VLALISSPPSLGRPFFTTQDVPPERVAALRSAFDDTMKDEGFLTEARQLGLDMQPMQADVVTQIVFATVNAPAEIVAKAKTAIEPQATPPAR
jgi:tripartite-type tricarboxylate transporter receptor subunit TctC